jgi:hypothetical protein
MRHSTLLMAVCAGFIVSACDRESPVQPRSPDPILFSSQVGSGIAASAVSPSEIDLSWANSPSASGYQVFRSDNGATGSYSLIGSTSAAVTTYANSGLTGSTQYCYEIRSFKTAGKSTTFSAYSNAACATTLVPPINAPSVVDVVPVPNTYFVDPANSEVRVSWKDNSTNEDGFRLERASTAAGPWTEAATTAANATSLYQTAAREQQVCFRVIAFSSAGTSTPASADCTTPPASPTNLVAKALDGQSIAITWRDNSASEDSYKLSRLDAASAWTDIATLAPNTVSYHDAGVTADRTYTYRVQALKDGGFSDYSNESAAVIATTPPSAPFTESAGWGTDDYYSWLYFGVSWSDKSSNEEGFRIESGDDASGWQTYATAAANATSFQQKSDLWGSLVPHAGCFRVVAFNAVGESTPSNVICTEWDNPPTNLTATAADHQSIDLSWTDNGWYERGYIVFRSTTVDGSYDFVAETAANATSYHDTGLASGQEYWYVVASDFGDYSYAEIYNYSDRVSATTLSATGAVQSSRTIINLHLTPIRLQGLTLDGLRGRHIAAQTSTAIGAAGATPIRVKRPVRQRPRIRGRKAP